MRTTVNHTIMNHTSRNGTLQHEKSLGFHRVVAVRAVGVRGPPLSLGTSYKSWSVEPIFFLLLTKLPSTLPDSKKGTHLLSAPDKKG